MSVLVLYSLIVKCFGAALEIGSQALISQMWSVEAYGEYAFFIALADGFYALFFSGIIKFNNYYIPQGKNVGKFRKRYYLVYAIPISALGIVVFAFLNSAIAVCTFAAGFAYLCAMDMSSRMMSFGKYKHALLGEYCIGRSFVILSILILSFSNMKHIEFLYVVYGLQFIIAVAYYKYVNRKNVFPELSKKLDTGSRSKYIVFQSTEIAHTIIMQTSVIVQYFFGGSYQTALISIVLVVRKLINFISGPTSKLYQPEFSKRYALGDKKGLSEVYAQITRIQMCFMMPAFMLLISKPDVILRVFNSDLISYGWLVRITAFVFLTMIAFGPLSNFLPMTGREKIDTVANWSSVIIMYLTMLVFYKNQYFVVIGFCAQILYVNLFKLVVFLKNMRCLPMPIKDYIQVVLLFIVACAVVFILPNSLVLALAVCIIHFIANFIIVFPKDDLKLIINKIKKRRHTNE